jgi:hypothetical protein
VARVSNTRQAHLEKFPSALDWFPFCVFECTLTFMNEAKCIKVKSQWLRGLRHEMSSPARIPLEAWMFVSVYSVFVLSCVGSGLPTG